MDRGCRYYKFKEEVRRRIVIRIEYCTYHHVREDDIILLIASTFHMCFPFAWNDRTDVVL